MTYEDLRLNSEPVILRMFAFMLDQDISGTVIEARIKDVCSGGHETKAAYKIKSKSANLSRNAPMYTPAQIEHLKTELRDYLHFYGYTNVDENSETKFFEYSDLTEADKTSYKAYQTQVFEGPTREQWSVNEQVYGKAELFGLEQFPMWTSSKV